MTKDEQQQPCHPEVPEARQQLCRCDEAEDCRRSNPANKGLLKSWIATLTTFARNDRKRAAFTLAEVPEARQYAPSPLEGEGWGEGFKKRAAFTLAEVLITLGIIGIVAAMTIPTLTKSYQKKVTVTRLRQTYSVLTQAIKLSEIDNGSLESWDIPVAGYNSDQQYTVGKQFAEQYLFPYMKLAINDCKLKQNICLPDKYFMLNKQDISNYYGASINHYFVFVLKNSTTIRLHFQNNLVIFEIFLDGSRKPAVRGKNAFYMTLTKNDLSGIIGNVKAKPGIYFNGFGYDRNNLKSYGDDRGCSKSEGGDFCGELIRYDGWQIKDDYPW